MKVHDAEAFEAMLAAVAADNGRLAKRGGAEGAYGCIGMKVARPLMEAVRDEMDRKTPPGDLLAALTDIAANALATVLANAEGGEAEKTALVGDLLKQLGRGLVLRLSGRGRAPHSVRSVDGGTA